ncbi:MAG: hypothetical protein OEZ43_08900 [Gammaproteobacteria bacterium]|nr:hypothetical protein [Gammaproteobacteria bacterium]
MSEDINTLINSLVPDWANWVAQDEDGYWWAFEAEPHIADISWYENEVGRCIRLIQTESISHWRETLFTIDRLGMM